VRRAPPSPGAAAAARFRFFGGKGGVGKTTCAAGAAIASAAAGRRVLLVSTDPAHSLGHAFGRPVSARPWSVPLPRAARGGALDVAELDADRALARFVADRRVVLTRILGRGTYLDDEDIEALLRLAFPGVDELIGLIELTRLAAAGCYPEVVVDTAPTGHALRLFAMPETIRRIASVLDGMQGKHRYLAESLTGRYEPDAADAAIDDLDARGQAIHALLRDPERAGFHWVTLPEAVAMEEARDGIAALTAAGMPVTEIIVNRVTSPPPGDCDFCERRVACEAPVLAEARARFPGLPIRLLPALDDEPRGPAGLAEIGRLLARPPRTRPSEPPLAAEARSSASPAAVVASPSIAGTSTPAAAPARAWPPPIERPKKGAAPAGRDVPAGAQRGWLDALAPPGVRLLLFAGKGGVGKTTTAAAVALALAERHGDHPVVVVSNDPAHSLGDVLAATLDDLPRPVPGAPASFRAREIDAPALFAERRARYLDAVDRVFSRLRGQSRFDIAFDRAVVERFVDLAPPGIDELLGLLAIVETLDAGSPRRARPPIVVVDTAPTGHLLRLLAMPSIGIEWVHTLMQLVLKYRAVIGLGQLGSDLLEMARALARVQTVLTDPGQARVVVVLRAAELPRLETRRLVAGIRGLRIAVSGAIVNALTPGGCARCRRAQTRERRVIAAFRRDLRGLRPGRCAIMGAPAVMPPPRGTEALAQWRRAWSTLSAP
jgi:arsenite-transporting ATPase